MHETGDDSGNPLDPERALRLAPGLTEVVEATHRRVGEQHRSDLVDRVTGHVGCELGGAAERVIDVRWLGTREGAGRATS